MKIATHCSEKSTDEQVNGFLVGYLSKNFLEVTNAFPLPDNAASKYIHTIQLCSYNSKLPSVPSVKC